MVQAVDRAVQILEICSDGPTDIQAIAKALDVHRTTALRLIASLEAKGLLDHDASFRYRIGYGLHALALRSSDVVDMRTMVHPHVAQLAEETGFSVHCAVCLQNRVVSLDIVEPPYSIRLPLTIGGNVVVNTAGVAKALLAQMEPHARERVLDHATWERYTERTITSREQFREVLEAVQERGWAYDDGEFEDLSNCVAAPFFNARGEVAGAISLTSFKARTPLSALQEYVPLLKDRMRQLSIELGCREDAPALRPGGDT